MFTAVVDSIATGATLSAAALSDAEIREALGACALVQGRLEVTRAALLHQAHLRNLWRHDGARSVAAWLANHTPTSAREARRAADTASIITEHCDIAAALAAGRISLAHVEVILAMHNEEAVARAAAAVAEGVEAPAAHPLDPAALLGAAAGQTPEAFAKSARAERAAADPAGDTARHQRLRARRSLRSWTDAEGMYHLHAELDPESGAMVERALNAVTEERWRNEHPDRAPSVQPRDSYDTRRADALTDIASRVLSGDGVDGVGGSCVEVIVVIDHHTLMSDLEDHGIATLIDGTPIPAGVARLWACENGVIPVVLDSASVPLDHGSKRRYASPAQRRALMLRSNTCEFLLCPVPAHACRAHHLTEWADSHTTDYANLALLCHTHHRMIHLEGWQVRGGPGNTIETIRPDGTPLETTRTARAPSRPPPGPAPPGLVTADELGLAT